MSKHIRSAVVAAAAAFVAATSLTAQLLHLPVVLGGAELGVLNGRLHDPHLLTGWLWALAAGACQISAPCICGLNTATFAALVIAFTLIASRKLARVLSFPFALIGASFFGLLLGLSPLGAALVSSPLGGEAVVSLALFMAACGETAGLWAFPLAVRCAIATALVLQDPFLFPAATAYAIFSARSRNRCAMIVPTGCAFAALLARLAVGLPSWGEIVALRVDSLAGPLTIAVVGIVVIFAIPAALYALRTGLYEHLGVAPVHLAKALILGVLGAAAGTFSVTGDPSTHLFYGEMAVLLCLLVYAQAGRHPRAGVAALAVLTAAQAFALVKVHRDMGSVVIAKQSLFLRNIVTADAGAGHFTCIVADASARRYVLVPGFSLISAHSKEVQGIRIVQTVNECPVKLADVTHLIVMHGLQTEDWGVGGLNLVRAASSAAAATYVFPIAKGVVSPRRYAHTPTGLGAFSQTIPVPSGRIATFIVVGAFSYRFDCVHVRKGERLSFAVGQIPNAPNARYDVSLRDGPKRYTLADGTLVRSQGPAYAWRYVSVPIPTSNSCAQVVFSAPSAVYGGGTWITFAGASLR